VLNDHTTLKYFSGNQIVQSRTPQVPPVQYCVGMAPRLPLTAGQEESQYGFATLGLLQPGPALASIVWLLMALYS
jgi:hypothetical protein